MTALGWVEMRMLTWMFCVTKMDNEKVRGTSKVGKISKKVQERRLKWYGYVMRRDEEYMSKRVIRVDVEGRRRKGRPKRI